MEAIPSTRTFLAAMCPAFFTRVTPASRNAKPACMNMTRIAAKTTQTVLVTISVSRLIADAPTSNVSTGHCRRPHEQSPYGLKMTSQATSYALDLLEPQPGPVVRDGLDRRRPDDPVAGLVAAPRGIGDRRDDAFRDLLRHHEGEHGLGQEARLEDPPAILVRDAALPPVADRLDDRDADMTGLLLDRVDHRLDPLSDHNCLDLDHADLRSMKTTSRQTPWCWPSRSRVPTTRNPQRLCSSIDASFSGKIPVWIVQIPSPSARLISSSSSARPTPRPCASSATYTLFSATP